MARPAAGQSESVTDRFKRLKGTNQMCAKMAHMTRPRPDMACQPLGASFMSETDSIQKPEASKRAMATQTIQKNRESTLAIRASLSGGAIC